MYRLVLGLHALFAVFPLTSARQVRLTSSAPKSPLAGCEGLGCMKAYVDLPDATYSWYDTQVRLNGVDPTSGVSWTGYVLNMTSQNWSTPAIAGHVNFPVWWHVLVVIIPSNLDTPDWANVVIESGIDIDLFDHTLQVTEHVSPREAPDDLVILVANRTLRTHRQIDRDNVQDMSPHLKEGVYKSAYLATHTRSVGASLFSSLNDYEVFAEDLSQQYRVDDAIKAYTWSDFMKHGGTEPERIMELPVAKAGVRALDTIAAFTATLPSGEVTRFGVIGFSKYGSCTWTLGALDKRVKAIAPAALPAQQGDLSINLLSKGGAVKKEPIRERMGRDYLAPYPVTEPHTAAGGPLPPMEVLDVMSSYQEVYDMVPSHMASYWSLSEVTLPIFYLDKITVPVFYTMATNDEIFPAHTSLSGDWFSKVPEPAGFQVVESNHAGVLGAGLSGITAFLRGQIIGDTMPKMDFKFEGHSISAVQAGAKAPTSVRLHYGTSCMASGEPVFMNSTFYRSREISETSPNLWVGRLDAPEVMSFSGGVASCDGHLGPKGAFLTFKFDGPQPGYDPYQISTKVYIDSA